MIEYIRLTSLLVIIATSCCVSVGLGGEPVSVVLTYEIDECGDDEYRQLEVNESREAAGLKDDEDRAVDVNGLVEAINKRLRGEGKAAAQDDKRIRIELYGQIDEARLKFIKEQRISGSGCLEFRILANSFHAADEATIKLAQGMPPNERDVLLKDVKVAEWVPYSQKEFGPVDEQKGGVVNRLVGKVPEMLVLIDELNVTGDYLTSAVMARDARDKPAIDFSLDRKGAEKLRQLTSRNKPNLDDPNLHRRMGIILDNRLLSAPTIMQTISDRGSISGGSMTESEVESIIVVLNKGSLPRIIRLVDEKRVSDTQ
jgi:preprotein translocase subunit SecD